MGRMVRWCMVVAALAAAALTPASAIGSQGAGSPRVSWKVPGRAREGVPIPFSWSSRHLGKQPRLVVQRPMGTARTWRTISKLSSRRGTAELPPQTIGRYRLRLAAFKGRQLLASQVVRVGVFGSVPFSVLLGDDNSGLYATPSRSFPYVDHAQIPGDVNAPKPVFSVKRNRCSAVHIDFVPGERPLEAEVFSPNEGMVTVVQQSRDPVTTSAPYDQIGSVDAELVPGESWSMLVSYQGGYVPSIYFNGYAVCSSAGPLS